MKRKREILISKENRNIKCIKIRALVNFFKIFIARIEALNLPRKPQFHPKYFWVFVVFS